MNCNICGKKILANIPGTLCKKCSSDFVTLKHFSINDTKLDKKSIDFLNNICLGDYLDQSVRVERTYAVLMYLLNVTKQISKEDADQILDAVKSASEVV